MITDDKAISINFLIDAVETIEKVMGLTPFGVYSDVRVRLDILEARINNAPTPPDGYLIVNLGDPFFIGSQGLSVSTGDGYPSENRIDGSLYLRHDGYSNEGLYSRRDGYWQLIPTDIWQAGQDLSGNYHSQTVIGLQGNSVSSIIPIDGYGLLWNDSLSQWEPGIAFGVGGDLSGNVSSQTVIGLQGYPIDSSPPQNFDVLTWLDSSYKWTPLNPPIVFNTTKTSFKLNDVNTVIDDSIDNIINLGFNSSIYSPNSIIIGNDGYIQNDGYSCIISSGINNIINSNGSHEFILNGESNLITGDSSRSLICSYNSILQDSKYTFIGSSISAVLYDSYINFIGSVNDGYINGGKYSSIISGFNQTIDRSISGIPYVNFSLLGTGNNNSISSDYSSIISGSDNSISISSSGFSSILNGSYNKINSSFSTIINGYHNTNNGVFSNIINGNINTININSSECSIFNGYYNNINDGYDCFITSGDNNSISGYYNVINNGRDISLSGYYNTILNGFENNINDGYYNSIISGENNIINDGYCVVSNGNNNIISGNYILNSGYNNTINANNILNIGYTNNILNDNSNLFGNNNTTNSIFSTIFGSNNNINSNSDYGFIAGLNNNINGINSTIIGSNNSISSDFGVAIGCGASSRVTSQYSHSARLANNIGDEQFSRIILDGYQVSGGQFNLTIPGTNDNLSCENGKSYDMHIRILIINYSGAPQCARFTYNILAHQEGGILILDMINDDLLDDNGTDWSTTISSVNSELIVQVDSYGTDNRRAVATIEWRELSRL